MSSLNSLFNRASFGVRCNTCLNLVISRIKLLRNKREVQLKHMRAEIFQYLQTGQEGIARIRVEHIIREQNIFAAYEILELFCEFVLARVPIVETQKDCPSELREAIASLIFASPRCSDLPELLQIRNLFTGKYGKEFISSASELRPDSSVNRTIIEKLSVGAPSTPSKLKVLKAIAQEYNLDWNSSSTEAEFSKKHEDLLNGSNPSNNQSHVVESSAGISSSTDGLSVKITKEIPKVQLHLLPISMENTNISMGAKGPTPVCDQRQGEASGNRSPGGKRCSPDVLEKARAAIVAAEHASAAARAAAQLVNVRLVCQASGVKPCD